MQPQMHKYLHVSSALDLIFLITETCRIYIPETLAHTKEFHRACAAGDQERTYAQRQQRVGKNA